MFSSIFVGILRYGGEIRFFINVMSGIKRLEMDIEILNKILCHLPLASGSCLVSKGVLVGFMIDHSEVNNHTNCLKQ